MDKPVPEAAVRERRLFYALKALLECPCTYHRLQADKVLTAVQQPDHIVDATKMVAQQQGQGACPECGSTDKIEDANGALVCGNHFCDSEPLVQPMQQGGGEAAPPSAPVGVEGLPTDALIGSLETKDALRALCKVLRNTLAQQHAAVGVDLTKLQRHVWSSRGWEPDPKGPLVQFKDIEALAQQPAASAVALTVCCGREECGGECGNEWRGMEWVRITQQPAAVDGEAT